MKLEVTATTHMEVATLLRESGHGHRIRADGTIHLDRLELRCAPELVSADLEAGSRGGWNETYTGARFYTFDPRAEDVRIADVAHSLSLQCRYAGNSKRFYSVAEHCCLLSDHARFLGDGGRWGREDEDHKRGLVALMHDAAEAYVSDLPRPIKYRLPAFREMEARIEAVLFPLYGMAAELPGWVRDLDSRILCDERRQVMLTQGNEWSTDRLEPLGVRIRFWPPARAEYEFLRRFYELFLGKGYYAARAMAIRKVRGSRYSWGLIP